MKSGDLSQLKTAASTLAALDTLPSMSPADPENLRRMLEGLDSATLLCHGLAAYSGWWREYDEMPERYRKYFIGTKVALIHSEASEAMEGHRKGKMDSHLPDRSATEVELADLLIRIFDLAGALKLDVGGAAIEKLLYNMQRPDHKLADREAAGGKAY